LFYLYSLLMDCTSNCLTVSFWRQQEG
jgi:hypothetical protein